MTKPNCPFCTKNAVVKHGINKNKTQRYLCKICNINFCRRSQTLSSDEKKICTAFVLSLQKQRKSNVVWHINSSEIIEFCKSSFNKTISFAVVSGILKSAGLASRTTLADIDFSKPIPPSIQSKSFAPFIQTFINKFENADKTETLSYCLTNGRTGISLLSQRQHWIKCWQNGKYVPLKRDWGKRKRKTQSGLKNTSKKLEQKNN